MNYVVHCCYQVVTLLMEGRAALEAIAPLSYFTQLSQNTGAVSEEEVALWLRRLEWEGDEQVGYAVSTLHMLVLKDTLHMHRFGSSELQPTCSAARSVTVRTPATLLASTV
jgi:hypothetical protein